MNTTLSPAMGNRKGNVTLKQIASDLGVSHQLVSYALNDTGTVGEDTRKRIKAAAERMGYRRNGSAMSMKSGRFGNVALLLSTDAERSRLPSQLWEGIHDELAAQGLHLTMARLADDKLQEAATVPKILREWMCDGLLIDLTHSIPASLLKIIGSHRVPAVWINSKQQADSVYPDDFEAGKRAAEFLLSLGHQRIAYMKIGAPPQAAHYSESDRPAGVAAALESAGLPPILRLEATPSTSLNSAVLLAVLQNTSRPTAMICYGPAELAMVIMCAAQLGLQVPHDVSVLIFGEKTAPLFGDRAVSQMVLPHEEVGHEAVKMLLRKIEEPQSPAPSLAVPFEFVEGDFCAPPR